MSDKDLKIIADRLDSLTRLIERAVPPAPPVVDLDAADAFVWHPTTHTLQPVERVNRVDLSLLKGIDRMRDILVDNTERFARGLPANNVLLWGARGMGKSSLVKSVHAGVGQSEKASLKLIEIHREDIETLPELMAMVRESSHRFIVFCDDLSFDGNDASYKSLKAALEGGIEGRPANVVFYATSNRRHLLPRDMMENERSTAINPSEAVEEKVSLSDRFGLWLGFHKCSQDEYLDMVRGYVRHSTCPSKTTGCQRRRLSGRRRAAPGQAVSPGNSCRIWRGGLGYPLRSDDAPPDLDDQYPLVGGQDLITMLSRLHTPAR